ncbi:MAG: hypothetical protein HWQ38_37790 [Nostoc sp. NMS7]|uniref:hypothetical protein n=1 Tax=Nostoc sp. NMS7 TaxID=2815391 RepID=UPI0025D5CC49|nr:hypothetical protein [Nostoc sp. NMS7]MBN3951910.1 hypothetical protein [Nostoc sp. NMS7]
MNHLKRLIGVLSITAISVLITNGLVCAQDAEKYFNVGSDSNGDRFLLDTTTMGELDTITMGKKKHKLGEVLKIYQFKDDLKFEYMLHASCGDERLWMVGSRVFDRNTGRKISEGKEDKEIPVTGDSLGNIVMKYYCQAIKARGWVQQQ